MCTRFLIALLSGSRAWFSFLSVWAGLGGGGQSLSRVHLLATPLTAAHQASLSFPISRSLLKLMSTELVMLPNHLILCPTLLLLPSIVPIIKVFSNESAVHIRWSKYWSFSISLPMNIQGWFPLGLTDLISLLSKRLSRVFSSTTVPKHQFFGAKPSLWSNSHIHMWLLQKPELWLDGPLSAKWCLCFLIWRWKKGGKQEGRITVPDSVLSTSC